MRSHLKFVKAPAPLLRNTNLHNLLFTQLLYLPCLSSFKNVLKTEKHLIHYKYKIVLYNLTSALQYFKSAEAIRYQLVNKVKKMNSLLTDNKLLTCEPLQLTQRSGCE